ncbi:hypothetical protein Sgou_48030 [Streptomyces gougerotii]|uniref:Uncharacterized protein n=2 Tax=Streptomyces diastaticus group TaxID=2849069 RepID=A0A8H9LRS7_9ACTN|nr:hypothetical protein Srut_21620 [Streptomyces rutgersensis]GFH69339.1 hypothetical protein Sdia_01070 [Streptomyces diastaticus subsp. diastaticus]GFH80133.1 hypothetical protein Sgou_48030 [Streptomyces gougerotii]GGU34024.1 hypothetical protein GCM10015534_40800 [Streptomyces diastaticus subsp. diastaticus]GGU77045.1 hypothetical protein GCM10010227_34000 [Streptomyces gougerotii]
MAPAMIRRTLAKGRETLARRPYTKRRIVVRKDTAAPGLHRWAAPHDTAAAGPYRPGRPPSQDRNAQAHVRQTGIEGRDTT